MINDENIKELHDFRDPSELFPNTNIRGGVCFFIWDKNYDYSNQTRVVTHKNGQIISDVNRPMKIKGIDIFIRDSNAINILNKVLHKNVISFRNYVSSRKPFGLETNFINNEKFRKDKTGLKNPILCYERGLQVGYVERLEIIVNQDWVDKWKVYTPYANNIGTELPDDNLNAYLGDPETVCTETYLALGIGLLENKK